MRLRLFTCALSLWAMAAVAPADELVDYVTIKLDRKPGTHFLTVYRDEHGRIAYLELTV